jgi:cytochrome c oxidase subunit IV
MNDDREIQKILSYRVLIAVLALLLILTAVTIRMSMIDLGKLNVWIALMIASAKSSLVIAFFMHMKVENKALKISLVSTLCFVAILIGFIFWDIVYR